MPASASQQATNLLRGAGHVLVLLPENPSGDMIAAAYGFTNYFDHMGRQSTIAFSDPLSQRALYSFLPEPQNYLSSLSGSRDLVLKFNTSHNDILDVSTKRIGENFNIYVTPEKGMIDTRDFSFALADFPYDAMIAIGGIDKEAFGTIYTDIPDLFYDVPIINIDNKPSNSAFGHVNLLQVTASTLSEIAAQFVLSFGSDECSDTVAQCFLAGIISGTDGFRATNTTPNALSLASKMIDFGADQQEIVSHLYKSQPLGLVKLWGRTLKKLQKHALGDDSKTLITTTLTADDFRETETGPHYIDTILSKIKQNHADGKVFMVIHDDSSHDNDKISAIIDVEHETHIPEDFVNVRKDGKTHHIQIDLSDTEQAREYIVKRLAEHHS